MVDEQTAIRILGLCRKTAALYENMLEMGDEHDIDEAYDQMSEAYRYAFQEITGKTISADALKLLLSDSNME